jgi:hypothetical protein
VWNEVPEATYGVIQPGQTKCIRSCRRRTPSALRRRASPLRHPQVDFSEEVAVGRQLPLSRCSCRTWWR